MTREQMVARLARLEEMERLLEEARQQVETTMAMLRHHPAAPKRH